MIMLFAIELANKLASYNCAYIYIYIYLLECCIVLVYIFIFYFSFRFILACLVRFHIYTNIYKLYIYNNINNIRDLGLAAAAATFIIAIASYVYILIYIYTRYKYYSFIHRKQTLYHPHRRHAYSSFEQHN